MYKIHHAQKLNPHRQVVLQCKHHSLVTAFIAEANLDVTILNMSDGVKQSKIKRKIMQAASTMIGTFVKKFFLNH